MTLIAIAPNGKKITHELWYDPSIAPVTFSRGEAAHSNDCALSGGVVATVNYDAGRSGYDIYQPRNPKDQVLRWQDEDGRLWADEDLTFKEVDE